MTVNVAQNIKETQVTFTQVEPGQYMIAVGGTFDGATVSLMINMGSAADVPITDAVFTEPGANVILLPRCTMYVEISGAGAATEIDVALSELAVETK